MCIAIINNHGIPNNIGEKFLGGTFPAKTANVGLSSVALHGCTYRRLATLQANDDFCC